MKINVSPKRISIEAENDEDKDILMSLSRTYGPDSWTDERLKGNIRVVDKVQFTVAFGAETVALGAKKNKIVSMVLAEPVQLDS